MRPYYLLTNHNLILAAQLFVTIWFLFDFFVARDSIVVNKHLVLRNSEAGLNDTLIATLNKFEQDHCQGGLKPEPKFEKFVLVLIDALGTKFLPKIFKDNSTGLSMPFLENTILKGEAIALIAEASSPTATMPRIKSLISGTVPSFLDIVYNFARDVSKFEDDNLLDLAKNQNKSIVFYGDDTWLLLFPREIFTRCKETFSLFAADYTTVDTNVTECALPETKREVIDWDLLILHYLGLDHIGHFFGTSSHELIRKKLLELDSVVEEIYGNMSQKNHTTLLVICGDHGMSDEGNHGGSSRNEVDTTMVFLPINRKFSHDQLNSSRNIHQVDFAVTISLLLGLPIPEASRGVAISRVLESLYDDPTALACASVKNLIGLLKLVHPTEILTLHERSDLLDQLNHSSQSSEAMRNVTARCNSLSHVLQKRLFESLSDHRSPTLMLVSLTLVTASTLFSLKKISIPLQLPVMTSRVQLILIAIFLIPIIIVGSVTLLMSEHDLWSIYSIGALILLISTSAQTNIKFKQLAPLKLTLFLIAFSIASSWNYFQLFRDDSILSSMVLPTLSIMILCNSIRKNGDFKNIGPMILTILLVTTKLLEDRYGLGEAFILPLPSLQVISMIYAIGFNTASVLLHLTKTSNASPLAFKLATGYLVVGFLLARRFNLTFLICNVILEANLNYIVKALDLPAIARVLIYVNFAQAAFYNQGNTNSFPSIDTKPAFYGQNGFSLLPSVILVALSTYTAQIYWIIKLFQRLQESRKDMRNSLSHEAGLFIIFRNFLSLSYYMYVCVVLREHIFIWSVLSPKLLYHFVSNVILALLCRLMAILPDFEGFLHQDIPLLGYSLVSISRRRESEKLP